jgi:hypothetical protein
VHLNLGCGPQAFGVVAVPVGLGFGAMREWERGQERVNYCVAEKVIYAPTAAVRGAG